MNFPQVGFLSPLLIVGVKAGLAALLGAWWILAAEDVRASCNVTRPVALPQRPPAQLLQTKVMTDRQSRNCAFSFPRPTSATRDALTMQLSFGESASTQVGITPSG